MNPKFYYVKYCTYVCAYTYAHCASKISRVPWRLAFPISFTMMSEFIIVNDIDYYIFCILKVWEYEKKKKI